jgi:hypothetical protein
MGRLRHYFGAWHGSMIHVTRPRRKILVNRVEEDRLDSLPCVAAGPTQFIIKIFVHSEAFRTHVPLRLRRNMTLGSLPRSLSKEHKNLCTRAFGAFRTRLPRECRRLPQNMTLGSFSAIARPLRIRFVSAIKRVHSFCKSLYLQLALTRDDALLYQLNIRKEQGSLAGLHHITA